MKIALIAMSGIRVVDRPLLEMGLTLPGFVERSRTIASLPSLGLLTLAGMTPPHHEIDYFEVDDLDDADCLPDDFDLAALSSYSAQVKEAYRLSHRLRSRGIPTVLGGLHASVRPREAGTHCDAVVVGDGEASWERLLRDAEANELRRLYRPEQPFDLARAPMPAHKLLDIPRYNRLTVQTSRGCPRHCEFCAGSTLLAPGYRRKPASKVLDEIDRIRELWPRPFIEFADDNSLFDATYWKPLLRELIPREIRWFAETDLSVHADEEMLALMAASGCAEVLIGFESPNETGLRGLESSTDWKRKRFGDYRRAIERIQSHGIRVNGCFILGLDAHGPEIFDEVLRFADVTELFDVQITILTPFPGTPLHERLQREGRLLYRDEWQRCTLFDVSYRPKRMSADELRAGFRELARRLYSDERTSRRRAHFRHNYLGPARRAHGEA